MCTVRVRVVAVVRAIAPTRFHTGLPRCPIEMASSQSRSHLRSVKRKMYKSHGKFEDAQPLVAYVKLPFVYVCILSGWGRIISINKSPSLYPCTAFVQIHMPDYACIYIYTNNHKHPNICICKSYV